MMLLYIAYALVLLFAAVVSHVLWGVCKVLLIDKKRYARYWQQLANEPAPKDSIRLLALGDSTFQAVGASKPEFGTVGRAFMYLEQQTGRPAHVTNLSASGAKAAYVAEAQLPQADFDAADLVIIAVGANDANAQIGLDNFKQSIDKIAAAVAPEKTIMADVAMVKRRGPYQQIIQAARDQYGIHAASLGQSFQNAKPSLNMVARDFFHPSDYGYQFWFAAFRPAIDQLIKARKLAK